VIVCANTKDRSHAHALGGWRAEYSTRVAPESNSESNICGEEIVWWNANVGQNDSVADGSDTVGPLDVRVIG